jgi:WD40 repeat protein
MDISTKLYLEDIKVGSNYYFNSCYGLNGVCLYGASNNIAVYNPRLVKVIALLSGHNDEVTGVKWIPNISDGYEKRFQNPEVEFVSCSADKNLICWKYSSNCENCYFSSAILKGHLAAIRGLDVSLLFLY